MAVWGQRKLETPIPDCEAGLLYPYKLTVDFNGVEMSDLGCRLTLCVASWDDACFLLFRKGKVGGYCKS